MAFKGGLEEMVIEMEDMSLNGWYSVKLASVLDEMKKSLIESFKKVLEEFYSEYRKTRSYKKRKKIMESFMEKFIRFYDESLDKFIVRSLNLLGQMYEIFNEELEKLKEENENLKGMMLTSSFKTVMKNILVMYSPHYRVLSELEGRGECSIKELESIVGMDGKKLRSIIKDLEDMGYVDVIKKKRPHRVIIKDAPWK
ncbi:MAG: MarR family transcriptional regulator [Candidatus Asgardarchaeia archaeon]